MSRLDQIDAGITALKEERKLAEIEAEFRKQKAAGVKKVAAAKAEVFKIASSVDEYEKLVAEIPPPDLKDIKQELNAARYYYRTNYRQPVTEGAAPAAMGASVNQEEPDTTSGDSGGD